MRLTFTPDAESDLDDLAVYLQSLPQRPALRIGGEIQEAIRTTVRFPGLGRVDDGLTMHSTLRILRFVAGKYILFYSVTEETICILGILHAKRDTVRIMSRRLE